MLKLFLLLLPLTRPGGCGTVQDIDPMAVGTGAGVGAVAVIGGKNFMVW